MNNTSPSDLTFLLFVIPGFLVVWTFRYFSKSKKSGDFEYLGLSVVWGLILFALVVLYYESLGKTDALKINDYASALTLCAFGFMLGWAGSFLQTFNWFKKVVDFLRPENFLK